MWIKVCVQPFLLKNVDGWIIYKGGEAVWGNAAWAPDDEPGSVHTHGQLISFRTDAVSSPSLQEHPDSVNDSKGTVTDIRQPSSSNLLSTPVNMTSAQAGTWILMHTPATFQVGVICAFCPI